MQFKSCKNLELYTIDFAEEIKIPFFISGIECGFPSPATDYLEQELDLNKYVVKNPNSTFYGRVVGTSMKDEGIMPGDIVVVDKSIKNYDNKICLCWYEDGFTLKKIKKINKKLFLVPKNKNFPKIEIYEGSNFNIWGVVTFYFKKLI